MNEAYVDREQTEAKHFILEKYLQTLAFKILQWYKERPLAYVDAFSGPWESKTVDYSDTSFMIAIRVLKSVQQRLREKGLHPAIRCYFVEPKRANFEQLEAAVAGFDNPADDFTVRAFNGKFEDAVVDIRKFVAGCFALTFIDPTGWTGFEFEKTGTLLRHQPGEVLLNYMHSFISRFTAWNDPKIRQSFEGILGKDWQAKLDSAKYENREQAVEAMFMRQFKNAGIFRHVVSTPIEQMKRANKVHFSIVYGTRNDAGLEAYRQIEYDALKHHEVRLHEARHAKKEKDSGQSFMFGAMDLPIQQPIDEQIAAQRESAEQWLERWLREGNMELFDDILPMLQARFVLRLTDVKDVCLSLARKGVIENTWKARGKQKPDKKKGHLIRLTEDV